MPIDPDDPIFGIPPKFRPAPVPTPVFDPPLSIMITPGRAVWLDPIYPPRPSKIPAPIPEVNFELIFDFRPPRVYPTVSQTVPAPKPTLSPLGSLTSPVLYNNVNYANQPKLKVQGPAPTTIVSQ